MATLVAALIGVGSTIVLISGGAPRSHERSSEASSSDRLPVALRTRLASRLDELAGVSCVRARSPSARTTVVLDRHLRRLTGLKGGAAVADAPSAICRIELAGGGAVIFVKVGGSWSRVPPEVGL